VISAVTTKNSTLALFDNFRIRFGKDIDCTVPPNILFVTVGSACMPVVASAMIYVSVVTFDTSLLRQHSENKPEEYNTPNDQK
jgi:hypothetical protein